MLVRDGQAACDCCGGDPGEPGGGCLPCGVVADGFNFWTSHFGGCINTHTPDNIPPTQVGDHPNHLPDDYLELGWNAPSLSVSGSWSKRDVRVTSSGGVILSDITRSSVFSGVDFDVPIRSSRCNVWNGSADGSQLNWTTTNNLTSSVISTGTSNQISIQHSFGGSAGACGVQTSERYNLFLFISFVDSGTSGGNSFDGYASTGDFTQFDGTGTPTANPCLGTGGNQVSGTGSVLSGSFFMFGTCASKSLKWFGSRVVVVGNTTSTYTWDITLTVSGMTSCPEEPGI